MKHHPIQSLGLGLLTAMLVSTVTWAAGGHAGGHGHASAETSYGKPGIAARVNRTIEVVMSDDMRFTPSNIQVRRGETVRFLVRNAGLVRHEFSLGTQDELEAHYEDMKRFPDMVHDEPNKVSVEPGQRGEVVWHFTRSGAVNFACLHVGHYEAGMKGQIKVSR